jgi:hypothetical protein
VLEPGSAKHSSELRTRLRRLLETDRGLGRSRGKICNWRDTTQTVRGLSKKEQKLFNSAGKSYGMFKPPLRTLFPGMHEHCPLRLGLAPRYAR